MKYTKHVAKEKRQQRTNLENQLKKLEGNFDKDSLSKYNTFNQQSDEMYYHIAETTQIRSKCNWYEFRKTIRISFAIKKLVADDKEITEQTHNLEHIREFYETLFKTREQKTETEKWKHFSVMLIFQNSLKIKQIFSKILTEKDLYNSLKSMQSDKSPGNDGFTTEFY